MKNYLVILLFFVSSSGFSQTCELKVEITEEVRAELLQRVKELFPVTASLSCNISNYDAYSSFDKISDTEPYDDAYLKKQELLLSTDRGNSIYMNNLSNYYKFHTKYILAESYCRRALESMNIVHFDKDSAYFYSFRGVLKSNLGEPDAIADMEKALRINPGDSIAISFYPMLLIQQGEYAKARTICMKALDSRSGYPALAYVFLMFAEVMEDYFVKISKAEADEKIAKAYRKMDYNKLIDFKLLDDYAKKYPGDTLIQNLRPMMDIFALMIKMAIFEKTDDHKIILSYTRNDIEKTKALEAWLKQAGEKKLLNLYSVNRNLGYLYFMRNEWDKSIEYFQKAIEALPYSKRACLHSTESYDAIIGISFLRSDTITMEKYLREKIAKQPEGKPSDADHRAMAIIYFNKDSLEASEDWLEKSRELNPSSFTTTQLMAHLYYLKGFIMLSQSYGEESLKYAQNNDDAESLAVQFGVYYLLDGDASGAYRNIHSIQEAMKGAKCEGCDELIEKYILVK